MFYVYLEGSTSPTANVCYGDNYICPPMSSEPILVSKGYYTADYQYELCGPGTIYSFR